MVTMEELFTLMKDKGASDLHLTVGVPPVLRIEGNLYATPFEVLTHDAVQQLIYSFMSEDQKRRYEQNNELDFAIAMKGFGRMRVNVFRQMGHVAVVIRQIPQGFRNFRELRLPTAIDKLVHLSKGLILVTGPTGSGKSTTLASMINYINETYSYHIVTVEDPVEFVHPHKKSIVNQREIGQDTNSFGSALKYVLRQDPDVILIGEIRDLETALNAMNAAETGHLVFGTLHTSDAVQTINRLIDMFPPEQQEQARSQLSFVLEAVISQQLLKSTLSAHRTLVTEILLANSAVRSIIRDKKVEQIIHTMQTCVKEGMHTMNQCLYDMYKSKQLTYDEALMASTDPNDFKVLAGK